MPRIIYDPVAGSDVSTTAQGVLLARPSTLLLCNLYSFANRVFWAHDPTGNVAVWSFTDADFPISVNYLQLFASGSVQLSGLNSGKTLTVPSPDGQGVSFLPRARNTVMGSPVNDGGFKHGALTYEVGLAGNDVDVTWFVDDSADYFEPLSGSYPTLINPPVSILAIKQAMSYYRAFDDCPFWIHRAMFGPSPYSIPMVAGEILTLSYIGGDITTGSGSYTPAGQGAGTTSGGLYPWPSDRCVSGGYPNGSAGALVGGFADENGKLLHQPYQLAAIAGGVVTPPATGTGPITFPAAPAGTTQFLLGVNMYETWSLNGGSWTLEWSLNRCNATGEIVVPGTLGPWNPNDTNYSYHVTPTVPLYSPGSKSVDGLVLLGTTLMYRGFIRETEAAADYLKVSLGSLMQIVQDTQVPAQLIQANARTNPFLPFPNVAATLTPYPSAGTIVRVGAKTYTMGGSGITVNQLQDCWVTFNPSAADLNFAPQNGLPPCATPAWRIQSNTASSGGSLNVTFYDPPIVPGNIQNINLFSPNSQTSGAPGFANVPPPDNSI
jgi:hypothetical protein